MDTGQSVQGRIIFDIPIITAKRLSVLLHLAVAQFCKVTVRGEQVWRIRGAVCSRVVASEIRAGGCNTVRNRPLKVTVWNLSSLDDTLNIFQYIELFLQLRSALQTGKGRFFLVINYRSSQMSRFFKFQHLCKT